jgi:hypothetical protein
MERIYQLPIDIRILIALSDPQTASLMYVYDLEFRKYATEPAFMQLFERFVLIDSTNIRYIYTLNNRELHCNPFLLQYYRWYSNSKLYRVDAPRFLFPGMV